MHSSTLPFLLRTYQTPQDGSATLDVFQRAVLETASADYEPSQVAAWAGVGLRDIRVWDEGRAAAHTFVAVDEARVVGFADFTDDGILDMLFVHPDAGGRGLGRALIEHVKAEARGSGLMSLRAFASRTAQPVFERLGFRTVEYRPHNVVRGHEVPNYEMRCDLTDELEADTQP